MKGKQIYFRTTYQGRQIQRSIAVWTSFRGQIPPGHVIHHINGDKWDDRLINLTCMSPSEHLRTHSPNWARFNGRWYRQCINCGQRKLPDEFYPANPYPKTNRQARCIPCYIQQAKDNRRKQKEAV